MADIWDTPPRAELDVIVAPPGVAVRSMAWPARAIRQATVPSNVIAARRRLLCSVGISVRDERECIVIMVKFLGCCRAHVLRCAAERCPPPPVARPRPSFDSCR